MATSETTAASPTGLRTMLRLQNVWASYDGVLPILQGATLDVEEGKIIALLGGNGAGKSTTLKAIAGLLNMHSGTILMDGKPIQDLRPHQIVRCGISFAVQGKDVFPAMTVQENLMLGAFIRNDPRATKEDLNKMFEMFPILHTRRNGSAAFLSGGERQMLVLARALMSRPRLLLVDEPSAALAPKIVDDVMETLSNLRDAGLTILLVEQNVNAALEIADHFFVLREGSVVASGDARDRGLFETIKKIYYGVVMGDTPDSELSLG